MELSGIGRYLEQYKEKLFSEEDQKRLICAAINRISGLQITEKDVVIEKGVIVIHTDMVTKNHLFMYKQKILMEIKHSTKKHINDLR